MKRRIMRLVIVISALTLAVCAVPATSASATQPSATPLKSGKRVQGLVTNAAGVSYTFTGVAGQHVTLAITNPVVSPSGNSLQINAYDASGANLRGTTFSTASAAIDFTPDVYSAGTITVVISPYQAGSTGTYTLTYAKDVTGALTSGTAVNGALKYQGQHAAYTFTGVAGQHVTLAVTGPVVSPSGNSLQINAYNASGANLRGTTFSTASAAIDFTPDVYSAGPITVVISPYQTGSTGSYTLTYATDVTGTLTSGTAVNGALRYQGQLTAYTFTGVAGQHVTLAVTNPVVAPSGNSLQLNAYNASGANLGGTTFNTASTSINFTPDVYSAGTITIVISAYQTGSTGSYTLTYAKDVTGALTSGTAVNGALRYQGQHAAYTFTGVAGQHVTLTVTNPVVAPTGNSLQMNAYNASGANLGGTTFSTAPASINFTPTSDSAGPITVVISPYQAGATGSYTLTLTNG